VFTEYFDGASTLTINISGDSINGGRLYKVIDHYGLLREDTITGKVWFKNRPDRNDTNEHLVMDLGLLPGDSFFIDYDYNYYDTLIIVDSVYLKNGLKHIRFNYDVMRYQGSEKLTFIEGVGSNTALYMLNEAGFIRYLLCASKDNVQTFSNQYFNGSCFEQWLGLKDLHGISYHLYPNPFNDYAVFTFDNPNVSLWSFTVYNIYGEVVKTITDIQLNEFIIAKDDLPAGSYFFRFTNEEGGKAGGKLLIE
jgi:hypothetical protein